MLPAWLTDQPGRLRPGNDQTIIEEEEGPAANRVDEQVKVAVAVDIGKSRSGRIGTLASNASPGGDILKLPVTQIAIENIRAVQSAKIKVAPSVSVHVASGHA